MHNSNSMDNADDTGLKIASLLLGQRIQISKVRGPSPAIYPNSISSLLGQENIFHSISPGGSGDVHMLHISMCIYIYIHIYIYINIYLQIKYILSISVFALESVEMSSSPTKLEGVCKKKRQGAKRSTYFTTGFKNFKISLASEP